jgi:hypothetical protein
VFLEGRREQVRTEETNLGNLTADANLAIAKAFDPEVLVSLKNGGGIRAAIGQIIDLGGGNVEFAPTPANPDAGKAAGEISQLDITNSLRFNNGLSLLTLTAQQLYEVIEHGVSASGPGNTPGQFPQVGGMSFSFDVNLPAGERVQSLEIVDDMGNVIDQVVANGELMGDPSRTIRIVTLNFLAGGGDGYPFPSDAAANRVNLYEQPLPDGNATFATAGTEQDALAEYLFENFQGMPFDLEEMPIPQDERIVQLAERNDVSAFLVLQSDGSLRELKPEEELINALDVSFEIQLIEKFSSVLLELQGPVTYKRTENIIPYSLFGDQNGEFNRRALPDGDYVLTATPFTEDQGNGEIGNSRSISFSVRNEPASNFTLVRAPSGEVIQTISEGAIVYETLNINISADAPEGYESLKFELDGPTERTQIENFLPYALFGDRVNTFRTGFLRNGEYTLTVTPYTENYTKGVKGPSSSVSFTVENNLQVNNIRLVNANSGATIMNLIDGAIVTINDLSSTNLTIVSDVPYPNFGS